MDRTQELEGKSFWYKFSLLVSDLRQEFTLRDLLSGLPDLLFSALFFVTFIYLQTNPQLIEPLYLYLQHWYAWELIALFTLPSIVWIFEKRGPSDPRSVDIPRWLRFGICLAFVFMFANFRWDTFCRVIYHIAPFLFLKAFIFVTKPPNYRSFMKACRRLASAIIFFVCFGIAYAFLVGLSGIEALQFEKAYGGMFFAGLYYLFFVFVEILACPTRRLLDLDEVDRENAF